MIKIWLMTHLLSTVIFKATNHLDKARGKNHPWKLEMMLHKVIGKILAVISKENGPQCLTSVRSQGTMNFQLGVLCQMIGSRLVLSRETCQK